MKWQKLEFDAKDGTFYGGCGELVYKDKERGPLCDRQAGTGDTGVGVSSALIASLFWMGGNRMSKDRVGEEKDVNSELEEWKSRGEGST